MRYATTTDAHLVASPGATSFAATVASPLPTADSASRRARSSLLAGRAAAMALTGWLSLTCWNIADAMIAQRDGAWSAAATAVAMLLSALVSSIAGFAFSALAGTALAYLKVEPVRAVQMMVLCSIATQLYAVWTLRASIRWRALAPMLAAGAVTVPLGVSALVRVDPLLYGAGLGIFLTAYGCMLALRRDSRLLRGGAWQEGVVGALGGLAGGLAGLPGAFVTIWCSMRGWDKLRQRAVYQPYILVMQVVTIVCLRWQAHTHLAIVHDLSVVPFALVGAIGGLAVFRRLTNQQFQIAVSALLVVSGMGLLARAL